MVITDIALTLLEWEAVPLLEVESACNYKLRCLPWRRTELVWLHEIGRAPSTPREESAFTSEGGTKEKTLDCSELQGKCPHHG